MNHVMTDKKNPIKNIKKRGGVSKCLRHKNVRY